MKKNKTYMAILLGLLVGAVGSAFADDIVLSVSQDATAFEDYGMGYGTWDQMRIRWQSDAGTWGRNNPTVQFDLSGITSGLAAGETIQVNSARFSFWAETNDDGGRGWDAADDFPELAMYYNTSAWTDVDASAMPTFDNTVSVTTDSIHPDGVTPNKFTAPDTIAADAYGWLFFDDALSATLVEYWVNGVLPNYGVTIQGTGAYTDTSRYLHLLSSENGSIPPYLHVDYTVIPEPATLSLFGVFGAAFIALRRKFSI